jgi:hypothetical protein
MRSKSPPAHPTTPPASRPGISAATPFERVLAALAWRETGAPFLPAADPPANLRKAR